MSDNPHVRILHETNPQKYFPALHLLAEQQRINLVGEHRISVFKEWLRAGLKDRTKFTLRTSHALGDLRFRLTIPFVHDETIVIGFAPWDWRVVYVLPLLRRNSIIYHTSWPDWSIDATPRQYGRLTKTLRSIWNYFVAHRNVTIVSVLAQGSASLAELHGVPSRVIPHATPEVFFEVGARAQRVNQPPLRLVYVGELSGKKGVRRLLEMFKVLPSGEFSLTLIGDGQAQSECAEAALTNPAITLLGPIHDRSELAQKMAEHDVLVLLSQREGSWTELFGIVVIEALATGLGVIATNHIGPASIFSGHTTNGLFDEMADEEIVSFLRTLASEPGTLERFRMSQSTIAEHYRITRVADLWFDVITDAQGAQS